MASQTGCLIRRERTHNRHVSGIVAKSAGARMAVQALQVAVPAAYANDFGRRTDILHIDVLQAPELVLQRPKSGVVGVAGITGFVRRHEVILKVLRRDIARICYVQAFSVGHHAVARNARTRLFGTLLMNGPARADAQYRKNAQAHKSKNLARNSPGDGGAHQKHSCERDRECDQYDEDPGRYKHIFLTTTLNGRGDSQDQRNQINHNSQSH